MVKLNGEQQEALNIIRNTRQNIFLTGGAGTGKSFILQEFKKDPNYKNFVVLAPTGTAAINVGGQTIHRFFGLYPNSTLETCKPLVGERKTVLENLDTIIIDEVSMVRADLLDMVDNIIRQTLNTNIPFGGKQMVFVGDLFQLPPIVQNDEKIFFIENGYDSEYFFDAKAYKESSFERIE